MKHETILTKQTPAPLATLADVLVWAEANGENYEAICELKKVPARMGVQDEDLGLLPADLKHFEACIAPTSYGMVSKARDLETARRRGNARLRQLLARFHAAQGATPVRTGRSDWTRLIETVAAEEGFLDQGTRFNSGTSRALMALRARAHVGPADLQQNEVERIWAEATSDKRRALRRGLLLLNQLQDLRGDLPGLAGLLPAGPLGIPASPDRAARTPWDSLPEALRRDCEAIFERTLARPEDIAAQLRAGLLQGLSPKDLQAQLLAQQGARRRLPDNRSAARAGYAQAVVWLWRAAIANLPAGAPCPARLEDLLTPEILDAACQDQIDRSARSLTLKDPTKSQTLGARLKALRTLARHGLRREDLATLIDLMAPVHKPHVVQPGRALTDEADALCRRIRDRPEIAVRFVQAPRILADRAEERLAEARAAGDTLAELSALRLYAAAALLAVQLSRPLRSSNLIRLRWKGAPEAPGNLHWIKPKQHAELRFPAGEIKNGAAVTLHVLGDDALILWTWLKQHRPRFLALRGLPDSPYLLPGSATPRHVKDAITLPAGCIAPATLAELWAEADAILGIGLTPHQCRHATATLILALEPGNFAKAAAVLGDTEETVRRHYGRDSGAAASVALRKALLERHPQIFKSLTKGRFR